MIDLENFRTASLYINNQLLSRGLLRVGQSIDFADPEAGDGGLQATMGRVMSIVNDLILRRDVCFPFTLLIRLVVFSILFVPHAPPSWHVNHGENYSATHRTENPSQRRCAPCVPTSNSNP
jgi:hypothetical protein